MPPGILSASHAGDPTTGPRLYPEVTRLDCSCQAKLKHGEIQELEELLEYRDIFAMDIDDYGQTNSVRYHIETGGAQLIRQPPKRLPLAKQADVGEMLKDMQCCGVIKESDSPWSISDILIWKKNRDLHFCVDYRKINHVTRKDCFPLAQIDDSLNTLAGAIWFSTLDLVWVLASDLHLDDKEKTAFLTGQGLW